MTQKIINLGTAANKGDGDVLRAAFGKVNDNFTELYAATGADVQIPNQATHGGKYLTTNGTTLSWATVATGGTTLPSQSGHEGKFLRTDSSTLSWVAITIPQDTGDLTNNEGFITEASELVNGANTVSLDNGGLDLTFTSGEKIKTLLGGGIELYRSGDNTIGIYNGYARINTFTTGGAKHTWEFDSTGTLSLPDAGIVKAGADTAQVGSTQTIADDGNGGLVGWGTNALSVAYDANIISTYPAGSTITFQDGTTATITGWDDYGPTYIDLFWDNPKTGNLFPITLTTANYAAAYTAPEWTFGTDGRTTFPFNMLATDSQLIIQSDGETEIRNLSETNGIDIVTNITNGDTRWSFGTDGSLTFPDGESSIYTLDPATSGGINGISISGKDRAYIGITNEAFNYGWDFRAFGLADYSTTLKPAIKFPGNGWLQEDFTDILNVPLQLGSQGSITLTARLNGMSPTEHNWVFGRDGRTTFPNGAVPEHSYGAVGDKEGMVVFDSDHIYYCIDDYVTETPSVANVNARAEDLAQTVSVITIEKASNPDWTLVEVNWTITVNAVTRTVTTIGDNVDPAFIDFTLDSFIILPETSAIAFTSGVVQPDIWVRTAWTSTNW